MTLKSREVIEQLLTQQLDTFSASFFYFKHQLNLPAKHRIEDFDEALLEKQVLTLSIGMNAAQTALDELKLIHAGGSTNTL